jgi:hypothetical protein
MKKIFCMFCLLVLAFPVWAQDFTDTDEDQYPRMDPQIVDESEFAPQPGLPPSDYEEVPREEQQYRAPDMPVTEDPGAPEDLYEADEEYLE